MTVEIDANTGYDFLVQRVLNLLYKAQHNRVLVAVGGIPGSGKSTVANKVSNYLNDSKKGIESVVVGMDGFHLYRSQLLQMEDSDYAFKRRGAPFTFDADAFVEFVSTLSKSCEQPETTRDTIKAPSFDHKLKDPKQDDISIGPSANVIIVEGIYTTLNTSPWSKACDLFDEIWFVEVEVEVARERLARRHVGAGIEATMADAYARADYNDIPNGHYILEHLSLKIEVMIR